MRRRLAVATLALAACTWSNSLYSARRLSGSALKAEREERGFDAGTLWGQAAVKAESAFARRPDGADGAEALWLRGRALAHLGDCAGALPVLERARVSSGPAHWSEALRLEVARCHASLEDPEGAVTTLAPLLESRDAALREEAMRMVGRALVRAGRWQEALERLAGDDDPAGQWDRAIALAQLGRTDSALATVAPRIAVADSSADWESLIRVVAREAPADADVLLSRLGAMRNANDTLRARWYLAAVQGALGRDDGHADRYLDTLAALPRTPSASQGRVLLAERRLAGVRDSTSLEEALRAVSRLATGDPTTALRVEQLARWSRAITADLAAHAPGSPEGDLALLLDAAIARDTLRAPRLAGWLLGRLERGWPASPYVAKALLLRLALDDDSTAVLRARLDAHAGSEYVRYLRGEETARFAVLEDSLSRYLEDRQAEIMVGGDVN